MHDMKKKLEKVNRFKIVSKKTNQFDISDMLSKISTGNTILFTGAGFSSNTLNMLNKETPKAKELANLIGKLGEFDDEDDLKFATNFYIKNYDEQKLIDLLKDQFTLKNVNEEHEKICSIKWRKIYTTNYDNSIKLACNKNSISVDCITLEENPAHYYKKKNICVHINGNIDSLKTEFIPTSFKLSTASYLSADSFINSSWYYYFKKDLEQASAIIFVGYSMYDIDIQKILFEESETFKKKTFFITSEKASEKAKFELSEFGKVYPIGLKNFANEIEHNLPKKDLEEFYLESFLEIKKEDINDLEIDDDKINDFLLHGNLDYKFIIDAQNHKQKLPYIVNRKLIEESINILKENNNLIILSDFGNGKTIFLKQLSAELILNGKIVYRLIDLDSDYIKDIEKIMSLNREIYLFIDNYENCIDLVNFILGIEYKNIKFVTSIRTSNHLHSLSKIKKSNCFTELHIDILNDLEIEELSEIIENAALWDKKAGYSIDKKKQIIKEVNHSQISHTLLNIFNAPQIQGRIKSLLDELFKKIENKDTILAICILEILDLPLTFSNISEVSLSKNIYNTNFINNQKFNQIFPSSRGEIHSKSSLYARNLLKNHFTANYIIDRLLSIIDKFQNKRDDGYFGNKVYLNLLRFSFIERVLPQKDRTFMLTKYYEQLKVRINNLSNTPHYWLQYAMARISIDDFDKAQNYLQTAYAKAGEGYDTSYIDVQNARLEIIFSLKEKDENTSIRHLENAHNLLYKLDDTNHKYRQVERYKEYFDEKYLLLSEKNKNKFINLVKNMLKNFESLSTLGYNTETNRIIHAFENLNYIIDNKDEKRKR
jgi:hypothetical protein